MPDPTQNLAISTVEPISLSTFDGGSIEDEFQEKLQEFVDYLGVKDNTGACTINIALTFKRAKQAGFIETVASVTSKIPAHKRANIMMSREGKIVQDVTTRDARQPGLFKRTGEIVEDKK